MPLFIHISCSMLHKSFCRSLTGHAHIKTLKYSIELRIGSAESPVFGKDFFLQFNHVNSIYHIAKNASPKKIFNRDPANISLFEATSFINKQVKASSCCPDWSEFTSIHSCILASSSLVFSGTGVRAKLTSSFSLAQISPPMWNSYLESFRDQRQFVLI